MTVNLELWRISECPLKMRADTVHEQLAKVQREQKVPRRTLQRT